MAIVIATISRIAGRYVSRGDIASGDTVLIPIFLADAKVTTLTVQAAGGQTLTPSLSTSKLDDLKAGNGIKPPWPKGPITGGAAQDSFNGTGCIVITATGTGTGQYEAEMQG